MECFFEFKTSELDDPFDDTSRNGYERDSDKAASIRGQVASYCAAILGSQFRVHVFAVLVCGKFARFMRWDRCVAVITQRFEYPTSAYLSQFILGYDSMTRDQQGHDTTVVALCTNSLNLDEDVVLKLTANKHQILRVEVPDLNDSTVLHSYLISYPLEYTFTSPFGRATRGMEAYDESTKGYVYIKDYWRSAELHLEGDIYRVLKEKEIPHIAPFGYGNDLPHRTISQIGEGGWVDTLSRFPCRQHYRMSLNKVLRRLTDFKSSHEFVSAIADAMDGMSSTLSLTSNASAYLSTAHDAAYFKAGILHCDVSVGNIMIGDDGEGFLIDWDLSTDLSKVTLGTQQPGGTVRVSPPSIFYMLSMY